MSDLNPLSDRLDELGRAAPAPAVDPSDDIRRGRRALRHRRVRGAAGISVALVAVGIAAVAVNISSNPGPGGSGGGGISSTERPFIAAASRATSTLCLEQLSRLDRVNRSQGQEESAPPPQAQVSTETDGPGRPPWQQPDVAAQVVDYRKAAAAILDPSGTHLDAAVTNLQYGCNPLNGQLATIGTKLGWTNSGALGVVQLEIVSPEHDEKPQIVLGHDHWNPIEKNLPAGLTKASATEYKGGRAVVVERRNGLTVAIDANGSWGNNAAPKAAPARDLPTIDQLLKLAASESLTLPSTGRTIGFAPALERPGHMGRVQNDVIAPA